LSALGEVRKWTDPQQAVREATSARGTLRGRAGGAVGHRTLFAWMRQGQMSWWAPVGLEIQPRPALRQAALPAGRDDPAGPRFEPVDLARHFNDQVTQIFRNEYRTPRSPYVSLAQPKQGIGGWAGSVNATANVDDGGLRSLAERNGGLLLLPSGVPLMTPGPGGGPNVLFTSHWDNYPREVTVALSGRARRVHLLMAGSTNWMQSRLDNGEVVVEYTDGTSARLALHNPTTWWPIDQDYFVDDFQFPLAGPLPTRVDLKTGRVRVLARDTFVGQGGVIDGGAATVLEMDLDPAREIRSLTVRALANEVVIGLMSATLVR
jgi:hypothetical protein